MDNDNKIKKEKNKVQLFLGDSLKSIKHESPSEYCLEKEFAKTRQNKDYFVFKIILFVIIFFGLGSFITTKLITNSTKNVTIDINTFEDLNLRNVLNLAQKAQDNLDEITEKRINRHKLYQTELGSLEQQLQDEKEILSFQRLSKVVLAKREKDLEVEYGKRKQDLKASLDEDIAILDIEFEDARKQVESFDTKRVEEAREQKKLLDNQNDLFELEKLKIKQYYENELELIQERIVQIQNENAKLKSEQILSLVEDYTKLISSLDPEWEDALAKSYLEEVGSYENLRRPFQYEPLLIPDDFYFSRDDFATISHAFEALEYLMLKINEIPFQNGTKDYILASLKIAFLTGQEKERVINNAIDFYTDSNKELSEMKEVIKNLETELENTLSKLASLQLDFSKLTNKYDEIEKTLAPYKSVLQKAAKVNKYDGFVISDDENLQLFFEEEIFAEMDLNTNIKARIYHPAKTIIADIEFSKDDQDKIEIISLEKRRGREILPLDYILIMGK